jgi:TRAP transporter TAXI family solute receptor
MFDSVKRSLLFWFRIFLLFPFVLLPISIGSAQEELTKTGDEWRSHVNDGTVRIITKGLGCTCTSIASDMAHVLNEMGKLRVLPVLGHGSLQGMADILYLKGIDLSIVQSDVLAYIKNNNIHPGIENRVRYITSLYNSELHLIAGPDIGSVEDLRGRKVSYDVKGRGSYITAENVFNSIGVQVEPVYFERDVAIEKIRTGEIAAAFVVTGKPASSMRAVKPGDGLHFVPVELNDKLLESYLPTHLTADDYPNLIDAGETVPTIAIGEVMAVFNWEQGSERYKKLETFIDVFFSKFDEFKNDIRHPKWKEVNLAADVPGWIRFPAAEAKLAEIMAARQQELGNQKNSLEAEFARFVRQRPSSENLNEQEINRLFDDFMRWRQNQGAQALSMPN